MVPKTPGFTRSRYHTRRGIGALGFSFVSCPRSVVRCLLNCRSSTLPRARLVSGQLMLPREAERGFRSFLQFARSLRSNFVHPFPFGGPFWSVWRIHGFALPGHLLAAACAAGGHGVRRLPSRLLVQLPSDLFTPQPDPLQRVLVRLERLFVRDRINDAFIPIDRATDDWHRAIERINPVDFVPPILIPLSSPRGFVRRIFTLIGGFVRRIFAHCVPFSRSSVLMLQSFPGGFVRRDWPCTRLGFATYNGQRTTGNGPLATDD
jgi:hypothetical protein